MLFDLHLKPASTLGEKRRLLGRIWRRTVANEGCVSVIIADLKYVHFDDHRVELWRIEIVPTPDAVARHFERRMEGFLEFEQVGYTRGQLNDEVHILLIRMCSERFQGAVSFQPNRRRTWRSASDPLRLGLWVSGSRPPHARGR